MTTNDIKYKNLSQTELKKLLVLVYQISIVNKKESPRFCRKIYILKISVY